MSDDDNPFPAGDPDRQQIWEMLVRRDIDAFLAHDWTAVAGDFVSQGFLGISGNRSGNPDSWTIAFPTLAAYRDSWLAETIDQADFAEELRPALFRVSKLRDIEIAGERALAHKKFDGEIARKDGGMQKMRWQSVYHLHKADGAWKIAGFNGYMPNPMGI